VLKRRLGLSLVVTSMLVSPSVAQTVCAPEKLNAAIDAYAAEPFGVAAWRKLNGLGDPGTVDYYGSAENYQNAEAWRKTIAEIAPTNEILSNPSYDCRIGYAYDVLQSRIGQFGKTSDYVKQWLRGQEAVFKACAGDKTAKLADDVTPANMTPADLEVLKQDRAYQAASILFYTDPPSAIPLFKAIAATASPHKAASRYNVANILANAKNVVAARAEVKTILADQSLSSVHDITRALQGYISNIEDTAFGWTELIDDTVATLSQPISAINSTPKSKRAYDKAVYDLGYAGIAAKRDDWWVTNTLPANATLSKAVADAARKHPMALWMMAGQSVDRPYSQAPWALIGDKWQAWSASYVDRAMALQVAPLPSLPKSVLESLKAKPNDASRNGLWKAALEASAKAASSCGEAPETGAVFKLAFEATRLSAMANRYDEIYANVPKLKLDDKGSLGKILLPKLMQHILAKGDVEEGRRLRNAFLSDVTLKSFAAADQSFSREPYAQFLSWVAEDQPRYVEALGLMQEKLSPTLLNLLPATGLRELSDKTVFSAEQRGLLLRAAWTRNYALGAENSDKTSAEMFAANPELAAAFEAVKKQFPKLKTERVLALTILRNPRFGILVNSPDWSEAIETKRDGISELDDYDPNDKNWWCPLEVDRQLGSVRADFDEASGLGRVKDYDAKNLAMVLELDAIAKADAAREALLKQHPMIKAVNWKEVQKLAAAPSAPQKLAQDALGWAKASKANDEGAAEALALAVRVTRYGCRWHGSVKAYSKPAQELLKAKFAATPWANQTPYWFDCTDMIYDAQFNKVPNCKPKTWPKQALPK
jgi:hypothetical protein